ncbi:MAG: hypothetical protein A3A33_05015 [Candidatus Yanofskybacteria bacterium RIFCSPLOWO2_01_FULL_49_25]|uniref:Methyltransferase domain-containing protein n=1 Tax=Candidatus Yanofskybacteria bacterium RIFCSPLOWO2_01_FULL_49_25 TaxID=1802701 RepID=A0A1F8GQE2_9BACT|nr:MAG: hypothetical protein A3A33_05015 [Candidatus Yanofskybacteria bacterium RIFCSPLOWO2_01_FULL_49_25]
MAGENTTGFLSPQDVHDRLGVLSGMKVADFGCGAGEFAVLIAKTVGPDGLVTAIDVLTSALESVTARARVAGLENVQTIRANLEVAGGSKLHDASQDMVLASSVLIQSKNPADIIGEAKRILKFEGTLAAIEWKKGATASFGPPDADRIDSASLQKLLEMHGFSIISQFDAGAYHYGMVAKKQQ